MDRFTGPGTPLDLGAFQTATGTIGCVPAALWALLDVETSGCGYLPDRRPKILFERHIFSRLTGGQYDAQAPDVSQPTPGGYGAGGANQYTRLAVALALDEAAALSAASWGLGQILGTNFATAGYATVDAMVDAFVASESAQLAGMVSFIVKSNIAGDVASQNWVGYAQHYNGPDYAKNHYDTRLAAANQRFSANGCPDIDLRAAQVYLTYLGYDTGGIDGILGSMTAAALTKFQQGANLPQSGKADPATLAALATPPVAPATVQQ
jgi:hypothetical protein